MAKISASVFPAESPRASAGLIRFRRCRARGHRGYLAGWAARPPL